MAPCTRASMSGSRLAVASSRMSSCGDRTSARVELIKGAAEVYSQSSTDRFQDRDILAGLLVGLAVALALFMMFLEVLVAFIQAYVFTILTCVYLKDALHPSH